ncbi:hypothetical protein D3C72_1689700 [compost metagenome]
MGAAGHRQQPAGRGNHRGRRSGGAFARRRLHALHDDGGAHHQRQPVQEAELRPAEGLRAADADIHHSVGAGDRAVAAGQESGRADCVRQGVAAGAEHGVHRQRHASAPDGRTVQGQGGPEPGARAVPWRRAHADRPDRRPGADGIRHAVGGAAPHSVGQAQGHRAGASAPGGGHRSGAHDGRGRNEAVRSGDVVRAVRAVQHARRPARENLHRCRQDRGHAGNDQEAARHGR